MLIVKINGVWAASYAGATPEISQAMNNAVDATFSSAWYIVVGSALAMFSGGLVNSIVNKFVGKLVDKKDTFGGFAVRSYLSTMAGQFVDNLVFGFFVSWIFFGWTLKQVFMCAFFMMLLETIFEVVFSPIGYALSKKWKADNVGHEYLEKYQKESVN